MATTIWSNKQIYHFGSSGYIKIDGLGGVGITPSQEYFNLYIKHYTFDGPEIVRPEDSLGSSYSDDQLKKY